jgi:predicted metalloprotease with PDZ domain
MSTLRKPAALVPFLILTLILGSAVVLVAGDQDFENSPYSVKREWSSDGAYLGVQLDAASKSVEGVLISEVVSGSPADGAGLQAGDLILAIDGQTVESAEVLAEKISSHQSGDAVTLKLMRADKVQTIDVELGERHSSGSFVWKFEGEPMDGQFDKEWIEDWTERAEAMAERFQEQAERFQIQAERFGEDFEGFDFEFRGGDMEFFGHPKLGVQVTETTPELREHLGGDRDRGVLIGKVLEDTPAFAAGIEVGDLILTVDGEPVRSGNGLRRALASTPETTVTLEVLRDGSLLTLTAELPEAVDFPFEPEANLKLRREAIEQQREAMTQARVRQRVDMEQAREQQREAREQLRRSLQKMQEQQASKRAIVEII